MLRAQGLKQREDKLAKDTENEHGAGGGRGEAGGRTREKGQGEAVSRSRKWSTRSDATERSGKVGP